ncbi:MAG: glycine cleavage system aminomethyltransferase GcvT [Oligosphaeraceae bacterium]|nr:glycine cleavage system aminomethyltransferase GcvT [Oligosphaeraceae bacterium]
MPESELLNTALLQEHLALGARMVPFAGWNMPVQYPEGILAEHQHTRTKTALFDICHMGEFLIRGTNARQALDYTLARPVRDQKPGSCRYNFLLNEQGGTIDDVILYCLDDQEFFLVVNASRIDHDLAQLQKTLPPAVRLENVSAQTAKLDLQGPQSAAVLLGLPGWSNAVLPKYFQWSRGRLCNWDILYSRTGYTGELGFEIYCPTEAAAEIWRLLLAQPEVRPAGLGARDTLRLEMGMTLYGHELDEQTTPLEAGMDAMLKMQDFPERDFLGKKALLATRPKKFLQGITLSGRRAARNGNAVLSANGAPLGTVTSGGFAPSLGQAIALAFLQQDLPPGTPVLLEAGGKIPLEGVLSSLPFYQHGTARQKLAASGV